VAALLALLTSLVFGSADFAAGLASRRFPSGAVAGVAQAVGLLIAALAVILVPGAGPSTTALGWGAISGVGNAVGLLALFHGLSVARMSTVVTLSAVLAAVIPAIVGVAVGNSLTTGAATGIAIAIPALGLVCWEPAAPDRSAARAGLLYGLIAGLGVALLFIGLDRAGTRAGAWPLIASQGVSLLLVAPFAYRGFRRAGQPARATAALMLGAGLFAGIGNVLFLAATGHGQLAIVAVLTALYPAVTVLLARIFLAERWSRLQAAGLLAALAAIVLISAG
jgi:drug/metabolite transporter (DMT)-like permease